MALAVSPILPISWIVQVRWVLMPIFANERTFFRRFHARKQRLIAGAIPMHANHRKKRITLALVGALVFGNGGFLYSQTPGNGPLNPLPQPMVANANTPVPIASTQSSVISAKTTLPGVPRQHNLEIPVVNTFSLSGGQPSPPSGVPSTIVQAQNAAPSDSSSGTTLPRPFLSRPSGPSLSSPANGASILPGSGVPQILSAPGSSPSGPTHGGMITLPPANGQIINQPGGNHGMMMAPGTFGIAQPHPQGFGSKVWNWMNPNPADAHGVTTLPITTGGMGGTSVPSGGNYPLSGPGMAGPMDGSMIVNDPSAFGGQDLWGMGSMPDMGSGGRCNSRTKFFLDAELLLWWINGQSLPPLVTYGEISDPVPGAMGQPHTQVAFGNGSQDSLLRSGGRITAGYWFGNSNIIGVDGQYLFVGEEETDTLITGFGNSATVGRPYTDALNNLAAAQQVFQPGSVAGSILVNTKNNFEGANINLRWGLVRRPNYVLDLQTGGRWQRFDEDLGIFENLAVTNGKGGGFLVGDQFNTNNTFYGVNLGLLNTLYMGRFSFSANTKLGLGVTNQSVDILGQTAINNVSAITSYNGGLLAMPTNIGTHTQSKITAIPELEFQVGFQLSQRWRISVGYNLLYWGNVVRPGNILDTTVNPNQFPPPPSGALVGPARPAFNWDTSDLFVQGANLGLEFRY